MNKHLYIILSILATILVMGNLILLILEQSISEEYPIRHLLLATGIFLLLFVLKNKPQKN